VIDLKLFKAEDRVPGLDLCNERFYLIAMAAPFAIEIIAGNGAV